MTPTLASDLLLFLITGLIFGHSCKLYLQRRWLAFDPLTFFFIGALYVYVLQPIRFGNVFVNWYGKEVFLETILWVLLSIIMVVLGYNSNVGVTLGYKLPTPPSNLRPRRLKSSAVFFIGIGVFGYVFQIATVGSLDAWLSVGRGATQWGSISAYLAALENFLPLGSVLLLFHIAFHKVSIITKVVVWSQSGLLLIWFLYLGSRSNTVVFAITIMATVYLPRRKNPPIVLFLLTLFTLFLVTQFQAIYRSHFTNLSFNLAQIDMLEARDQILPGFLGGGTHPKGSPVSPGAEFSCVMTAVKLVPEEVEYNYGYCLLEFFTRFIPRTIWPAKRYPHYEAFTPIYYRGGLSQYWVPTSRRYILAGPSFTFVGHWYSVGGPLILLIAGFATGCGFRMIRTVLDRNPLSEGGAILYVNLVFIGLGEAVGTPLFWIFRMPFIILSLILIFYYSRETHRARQNAIHNGSAAFPPVVHSK